MSKKPKITLQAWAARSFDPPPELATLRSWARSGKITPAPVKAGRAWMVDPDAEYCADALPPPAAIPEGASPRVLAILRAG